MTTLLACAALVLIAAPSALSAQKISYPGSITEDTVAWHGLIWRDIGIFRGGRSIAVSGSASRPYEYWMGTTGGGVFKTTDGGNSWSPASDGYFGGTIGSIDVSASDPDIVYVGTGEHAIRGNVSHGDGMFKTTDGGKHWSYLGLAETQQIARVRVHPTNPDIVWVAALGHVFGPNPDRGIFKTTDGGKTWRKVLFRNDSTGAADLAIDPSNPDILYATFWQSYRKPWTLVSGGAGSSIYKSTDGGEHWTDITHNKGLPSGILGRMGIDVSRAKPSLVWAVIEADSGGLYRSDDAGATWRLVNSDHRLRERAWYYMHVMADPKDTNIVYSPNVSLMKSADGGKTFTRLPEPHGDDHDLWIAPNDGKRMIQSSDGGASVSFNRGETWTDQDYSTAQFYHVETTNHFPYRVCGAQQDNSTLCGPSRENGGISIESWYDAGGGESGYIAVRPDSPDVMFAGSYGGLLTHKDAKTEFERDVNPWPDNPMGHDAADPKFRFQWTFPIIISPHNPNRMYMGSSVIFQTDNEGQSWKAISPDLTRHDPRTLGASGGPITKDQTSVEYYATVFTIAESPVKAGVIWAGSDDGLVHVTKDGGKTWTNVTPKGIPEWMRMSMIEASNYSAGTAYLAGNRYQLDDFKPYLFKTSDYGATWTPITTGIPATEFTRVIREDPTRQGLLYAGTERGVWVSFDDGAHWQTLRRNLPLVAVHDLAIKEGDLIAATHGRGFWILDDLSALRQLSPATTRLASHLFKPRPVYRASFNGGGGNGAAGGHPSGANPPSGAVVSYWLGSPKQTVTLDFLDAKGKVIRSFTSLQDSAVAADSVRGDSVRKARNDSIIRAGGKPDTTVRLEARGEESGGGDDRPQRRPPPPRVPNKAGINTFSWNLRYPDAVDFENRIFWAGGVTGPLAVPGTYAVRMTVNGKSETMPLIVLKDPRVTSTQADLQEQFNFLIKIRDRTSDANNAVRLIRNVKAQLADRARAMPAARASAFKTQSDALVSRLSAIEAEIYQVKNQSGQDPLNYPIRLNNKIAALAGVVGGGDYKPTAQSYAVFNELSAQLDVQLAAMKSALKELDAINSTLEAAGLKPVVPSTAEVKPARGAGASTSAVEDDDER